MKVFITGIAGFLGSHIADKFIALGHEVVGCDSLIGGYEDNVPAAATFYKMDLIDLDGLAEKMQGCDLVYHTACTAYEGLSVFSPSLIVQNTTQISVNAMVAAIQADVKRFVHCSSMARYGMQDVTPFTEDMTPRPQDPYGIAKLAAEMLLKNLAEVHDIELVISVPHNIVGARQKYDDPYRNVASIMINLMLQGRQPIIYGDGSQTRCFSDIRDDIDCLVNLGFSDRAVGETFNIDRMKKKLQSFSYRSLLLISCNSILIRYSCPVVLRKLNMRRARRIKFVSILTIKRATRCQTAWRI